MQQITLSKKIKFILNFLIPVLCLLFFSIYTLSQVAVHVPWRDEANAWIVAGDLNWLEIIKIMKWQGHCFLWYYTIKPFASNNFFYPYSMLLTNWLFAFLALIIMWIYAPFNKFLKALITFSFPLLQFHSIIARGYALEIFLLFVMAALFKKRLLHPYIYTLLIFLTANTDCMGLVGAIGFGIIFLFDISKYCIKNNDYKKISIVYLAAFTCFCLVFTQIGNPVTPEYALKFRPIKYITDFFFSHYRFRIINPLSVPIIILTPLLFACLTFIYNRKTFIFWITTNSLLLYIFLFKYPCKDYHFYFLLIYLLISYWLFIYENKTPSYFKNLLNYFIILLTLISCLKLPHTYYCYKSPAKDIVNIINNSIDDIESYKIFCASTYDTKIIIPYLPKADYRFIDGKPLRNFEHYKECWHPEGDYHIDLNKIYNIVDNKSVLILRHNLKNPEQFNTDKIKLKTIFCSKDLYIGKLEKI